MYYLCTNIERLIPIISHSLSPGLTNLIDMRNLTTTNAIRAALATITSLIHVVDTHSLIRLGFEFFDHIAPSKVLQISARVAPQVSTKEKVELADNLRSHLRACSSELDG